MEYIGTDILFELMAFIQNLVVSVDQLHSMWTAALILWKKYSRTYSFPLGNFFGKNILTIFIKLRGEICRLQATPKNNGDGCSLTKWPVFEASSKHSLMIRKDWHKIAKIVINTFFLQFFTRIHVECLKFHNLDAESQYQCF